MKKADSRSFKIYSSSSNFSYFVKNDINLFKDNIGISFAQNLVWMYKLS